MARLAHQVYGVLHESAALCAYGSRIFALQVPAMLCDVVRLPPIVCYRHIQAAAGCCLSWASTLALALSPAHHAVSSLIMPSRKVVIDGLPIAPEAATGTDASTSTTSSAQQRARNLAHSPKSGTGHAVSVMRRTALVRPSPLRKNLGAQITTAGSQLPVTSGHTT